MRFDSKMEFFPKMLDGGLYVGLLSGDLTLFRANMASYVAIFIAISMYHILLDQLAADVAWFRGAIHPPNSIVYISVV